VRTSTPVPTITGTRTIATPVVTATPAPTETPGITPLEPTDTPRPTRTPDVGMFATTTADAPSGTFQLQVDVAPDDLVSFPVQGVVQVFGESFEFTRRRTSRVLNLTDPDGLPFTITAGTVLLVIDATPGPVRPGPVIVRNEQGGSCAIQTTPAAGGSVRSIVLGLLVLAGARRLRRRR
jgi:MYXO-CTERM domain-containing protein